jgi:thymidylate synthase ThyX
MAYECKILADSISPDDVRLTTFEITFPRIVLAEFNTHRMFSRNSASSRAIPFPKMLERVKNDPFIPTAWPTEQKGMSGGEPLDDPAARAAVDQWKTARNRAVESAQMLAHQGVHKSLINRLLEPFMWHTVIVTATEWDNYFGLRTDENAQPEIRTIALMMEEQYKIAEPKFLRWDEWHLPLVTPEHYEGAIDWDFWKKVSVGRCARVSYLTHDGKRDYEADVTLHDRLKTNGHLSPFEHVARPLGNPPGLASFGSMAEDIYSPKQTWSGNFKGWHQYRADIPYQSNYAELLASRTTT